MPKPASQEALPKTAEQFKGPENVFAQEVYYQAYRLQNVVRWQSPEALQRVIKQNPELIFKPMLFDFFEAYKNGKMGAYIEKAKKQSTAEREKLLSGIRQVIYKAKVEEVKEERKKVPPKKENKEEKNLETMLSKTLNDAELRKIESDTSKPFIAEGAHMDLNKVQTYYTTIILGQKALGSYAEEFQENYNNAIKKLKEHQDSYTSGWKHYAGIADWGWRKVKGAWGWGKEKLGYGASKSNSDKINELVSQAKIQCKSNLERVKALKENLANRSKELVEDLARTKPMSARN